MSVYAIHSTSKEVYEVEIFVKIANKDWVEVDMYFDFHSAYSFIFNFWIYI